MKKSYLFLLLLSVFFSCKKEVTIIQPNELVASSVVTSLASTAAVNQDTVPPASAISVKNYGAVGDGVKDDTQAIQAAINKASVILLPKGTYIINQTLVLRSGIKIYGTNGATIKAGPSMSGTLLVSGRYFSLNSVSGSSIINIGFQPSATKAFTPGAWANAVIYISNSPKNSFKYNVFNFKQSYAAAGIESFWVSGTGSTNNFLGYNKMYTLGLEYAEAGASYNTIIGNYIENAHSNGMSAHGNATVFCTNNQVINNKVINAGHMGIEDFGKTSGTLLKGNIISGTGKSPTEGADGMGMSLVGVNTVAVLNTLSDAKLMYMEIGGNHNQRIDSNLINDANSLIPGIVVNFRGATPAGSKAASSSIGYNSVWNCWEGISVEGDINPNAKITGNKVYDSKYIAINVNSNAGFNVNVSGNTIIYNKPSVQSRNAICGYSSNLSSAQIFTVANNTITYNKSATGGKMREISLLVALNNVSFTGNKVYGNNILAGGLKIQGISANGNKFSGITLLNNVFNGALMDISGLSLKTVSSNTVL
jgi:hypothetical protein